MNYYEYNDYLAHYGIKGMKWGVRRFQNKDGSLTALGRKHIDDSTVVLPKGATIYRATRGGSKRFMKRGYTYVTVGGQYADHLYNTSDGFEGRYDVDYKMISKRPLKIASTEDYFNAVTKANGIDPDMYLNKVPKDVTDKGTYAVMNLLEHKYVEGDGGKYEALNNAVNYLRNQGYDGVIDPIDGSTDQASGSPSTATIVFNPKRNLKIVEEKPRNW